MVRHNSHAIALDVLFSLGEMVKNEGGKEILRLVEEAIAGRRLDLK
jgi:hypothetical protein